MAARGPSGSDSFKRVAANLEGGRAIEARGESKPRHAGVATEAAEGRQPSVRSSQNACSGPNVFETVGSDNFKQGNAAHTTPS